MFQHYPMPIQEEELFQHLLQSHSNQAAIFDLNSAPQSNQKDNETDPWILNEIEPPFSKSSFDIVQELDAVKEARKDQRRQIYKFLEEQHGGKFRQFATKMGRQTTKRHQKKKIRKIVSLY